MSSTPMPPTRPNADRDEDMPAEIDFSKGARGKFYRANVRLSLPVHLDASVANALTHSAEEEGIEINAFVAQLLDEHRHSAKPVSTPRART